MKAQEYFKDKINVSLFGGYFAERQNTNNNGNYYGVYADYLILKTWNGWSLGPYIISNRSEFVRNMIPYESRSLEIGGGMTLGYYSEFFTASHQMFTGLSLGYKHIDENGESLVTGGPKKGHYVGEQTDHLLTSSLNANLLKDNSVMRPDLLPRTQLIVNFQIPLQAEKRAYWNEEMIPDSTYQAWDKTFFDIFVKQSLVNWPWGNKVYCSPKAIAYYSYSYGAAANSRNFYAIGQEISWHKPGKDDFLSINLLYKFNGIPKKQNFVLGFSLNFGSLISK